MLLHAIAQPYPASYTHPFIDKYIFPGGYIPALSEVLPPLESARPADPRYRILTLHYAETTREWRRRFLARRDRVLELIRRTVPAHVGILSGRIRSRLSL